MVMRGCCPAFRCSIDPCPSGDQHGQFPHSRTAVAALNDSVRRQEIHESLEMRCASRSRWLKHVQSVPNNEQLINRKRGFEVTMALSRLEHHRHLNDQSSCYQENIDTDLEVATASLVTTNHPLHL